jgi:hypothetical protein
MYRRTDIVVTSEPSRPVATALKIDITKADETDFEKLGIDVGVPLQDPEAVAIPANIGHPVFRHHVEMQGLPVLKAVDPSKVRSFLLVAIHFETVIETDLLDRLLRNGISSVRES